MRTGILAAALIMLFAASCGGSDTETTVRTTQPGDAETAATGVAELDHTLNAALRGDRIALAGLTGYQRIGCVEQSQGAGSAPVCRDGEPEGEQVEAFPVLQCELAWVRPEVMPDTFGQALGSSPQLVSVYEPVSRPLVLAADYVGVLRTTENDPPAGVAISIRAGRVIQIEYDCNNFAGLSAPEKAERFLVRDGENTQAEEPSATPAE